MILKSATVVSGGDYSKLMWNGLRRFHHVPTIASRISDLHSIPRSQRSNANKQASQIRHCLVQAREYRDASQSVSLATKPLLLYYSAMSLALAQILLKSDGNSSLDRARGDHAHHGLILSAAPLRGDDSLADAAARLRASPMLAANGDRRGTFELWQRTSREDPLGGVVKSYHPDGGSRSGYSALMASEDQRFGTLPIEGVSLLDCFQALPGMRDSIRAIGLESKIVRAKLSVQTLLDGSNTLTFIAHPERQELIDSLVDGIVVAPRSIAHTSIKEFSDSIVFELRKFQTDNFNSLSLPASTCWNSDEIRILPKGITLNEFGLIYVSLYILGNYARYFPDRWMVDVDSGSPLSHAVEAFLDMAEWRMALLTYSDFSGSYIVPAA